MLQGEQDPTYNPDNDPNLTSDEVGSCEMPTASLTICKHRARYAYATADGTVTYRICAQHYRAKTGYARLLRPLPWDYATVTDLASGVTVERAR